jgi:hypothetical protein
VCVVVIIILYRIFFNVAEIAEALTSRPRMKLKGVHNKLPIRETEVKQGGEETSDEKEKFQV